VESRDLGFGLDLIYELPPDKKGNINLEFRL
jgi:hypothetical protein